MALTTEYSERVGEATVMRPSHTVDSSCIPTDMYSVRSTPLGEAGFATQIMTQSCRTALRPKIGQPARRASPLDVVPAHFADDFTEETTLLRHD